MDPNTRFGKMSQRHHPLELIDKFLEWYCSEELLEEIQGDLHEAYHKRRSHSGKVASNLRYLIDVFRFFKPYSFEKHSNTKQYLPMYNNYLKIASRNLFKRKALTIMNIVGLVAGISSIFLVSLYIHHELTYDVVHPDAERIFRLVNQNRDQKYTCMQFPNWDSSTASQQIALTNKLKSYGGVEEACHFVPNVSDIGPRAKNYIRLNGAEFVEDRLFYTNTGEAFQSMFPQQFLAGSPEEAFSTFGKVVLTESKATKFFGKDWEKNNVIGSVLTIQNEPFEIGGVIKNLKGNIHFDFDILVHQATIPSWGAYTYMKVAENSSPAQIVEQLNKDIDAVFPGYTENELQKGISLVPLREIHFTDGMLYELKPFANRSYLFTFALVGVIILLIIWTNHANLSIAVYAGRQKEMGVRKVLGAKSGDITAQIICEAILLTLICIPFAWLTVYISLPDFNELMFVEIPGNMLYSPTVICLVCSVLVLTGLISGLYPSILFSRKSLVSLFSSKLSQSRGKRHWNLRNGILATQFFLLVVLISVAFVIRQQMQFIQQKELGFQKEGIVYFDVDGIEKYRLIKQKLDELPEVSAVGTGLTPAANPINQLTYKLSGSEITYSNGTHIQTSLNSMEILGIRAGAFDLLKSQDSVLVINETAAMQLCAERGLAPHDLIGKTLILEPEYQNARFGYGLHYVIADIVADFDYFSLKYESQPLIIEVNKDPAWAYSMMAKITTDNVFSALSKIEETYLSVEKEQPFSAYFLDEYLDQRYQREKNAGILTTGLTGVSTILAVMGLIGVVGFITLTRQKEMGIRKVFGASTGDILWSLSRDYVLIIGVASLASIPAAIYLSNVWLDSFAYHVTPSVFVVLGASLFTCGIVLLVVILQSYKSAAMSPSEIMRDE
jgi:putative ABC transport system permease protein